jgi:ATP-dependent Zn protease
VDRQHIEVAIQLMTGEAASLPDRPYRLGSVLKALRPGVAAVKVVADLKALHKNDRADDEANASTVLADWDDVADEAPGADQPDEQPPGKAAAKVTRLRDLAGFGEARDWGLQLAADFAEFKAGRLGWEDVDKGLLLSGPPGSGKTFFAVALAAECEVPLLRSSYADWEAATGPGNLIAEAIQKAFAEARKEAPCIVFIDELDSVGSRGKRQNNNGWFDVVINALLAELDGAEPRTGVVVVGATNHPDLIDPALLRPGRLDRHFRIPKPTIDDLKTVLAHHLGKLDGLERAARACRGLSPAAVAQVAREARRAARKARRDVGADDVVDAIVARRGRCEPKLDWRICVHESGHALVGVRLGLLVSYVDADAGETAIGDPIGVMSLAEIETQLTAMMGGRAAETAVFGAPTSGAIGDLARATSLAHAAVAQAGLTGSLIVMPEEVALVRSDVRRRVEHLMARAMDRASEIVLENRQALDALVDALAERRYLDADEVKAALQRPLRTRRRSRRRKASRNNRGERSR